ncbi:MAG: NAD-dependent epimerase/dehydratase family protein [Promethearchaeota archaeon]
MKAVITGATGFLGGYLIQELQSIYDEIYPIVRDPKNLKKLNNEQIIPFQGDITVPNTLKNPFSKADHCYHAAAKVSSWPKDPQKGYVQTNVLGTQNVLDIAQETNIERLIYTSSFNALGETGEEPQTEQWDNPHSFTHPYFNTKYDAGKLVEDYIQNHDDLNIITVIPTFIIGLGMNNPVSTNLLYYLNGKLPGLPILGYLGLPGGGKVQWNFVLAESVAKGHVKAALKGKKREKYILGSENLFLRDFFHLFGNKIGLKPPGRIPYFLASLYSHMLEFGKNPALTVSELQISKRWFIFDSSKAINELDYSPEPIEKIIRPWLKEQLTRGNFKKKTTEKVKNYLEKNEELSIV